MPEKELIIILATKVMEWTPVKGHYWMEKHGVFNCDPKEAEEWVFEVTNGGGVECNGKRYQSTDHWNPLRNLNECRKIEKQLKKKGLVLEYVDLLEDVVQSKKTDVMEIMFDMLNATAEQKCRAAAMTIMGLCLKKYELQSKYRN